MSEEIILPKNPQEGDKWSNPETKTGYEYTNGEWVEIVQW